MTKEQSYSVPTYVLETVNFNSRAGFTPKINH